jgi:hypothetical protein
MHSIINVPLSRDSETNRLPWTLSVTRLAFTLPRCLSEHDTLVVWPCIGKVNLPSSTSNV